MSKERETFVALILLLLGSQVNGAAEHLDDKYLKINYLRSRYFSVKLSWAFDRCQKDLGLPYNNGRKLFLNGSIPILNKGEDLGDCTLFCVSRRLEIFDLDNGINILQAYKLMRKLIRKDLPNRLNKMHYFISLVAYCLRPEYHFLSGCETIDRIHKCVLGESLLKIKEPMWEGEANFWFDWRLVV